PASRLSPLLFIQRHSFRVGRAPSPTRLSPDFRAPGGAITPPPRRSGCPPAGASQVSARSRRRGVGRGGPQWADRRGQAGVRCVRSEQHTSELQSLTNVVCRPLLEKKKLTA